MKKFEEKKAAIVEMLTDLANLASEAGTADDIQFLSLKIASSSRFGRDLSRKEINLSIDFAADIFRFVDGRVLEKNKNFEKDKAAIVEVLTDLAAAVNAATTAATTAAITQFLGAIGSRVPDARDRRRRGLYIRLTCDILHFLSID